MEHTEDITYFSVNAFSKGILEFAEKVEYAKALQSHQITVDEPAIRQLEQEIGDRKWAISEFLESSSNYEEWKNFGNNNAEMLTKYVQKDYFQEEFAGTKLKERLQRDFGESLASHPELALTKREKNTFQNYEENMVPQEQRVSFNEFDPLVAQIHNKEKCFTKNFSKMLSDLPAKMTKDVDKAAQLVKSNPLLLKDNPHHYVVNRGTDNPSVSSEQFKDILEDANMGDPTASKKLDKLTTSMLQMKGGNTSKALVEKYRKQFSADNTPSAKKEI